MSAFFRTPRRCLFAIWAAGLLAPERDRAAWRERWREDVRRWQDFLIERGQWNQTARARLVRHCWGAFAKAFWLRFDRERTVAAAGRVERSPAFAMAALAVLSIAAVAAGGWFDKVRASLAPLPFADPARLVTLAEGDPFMGRWVGVPASKLSVWERQSQTVQAFAAHTFPLPRWSKQDLFEVRVAPGFFDLLGVRPAMGRGFQPDDAKAVPAPALLTHQAWVSRYGQAPGVIGREMELSGRAVEIVGILPPEFEFLWTGVGVYSALSPPYPGVSRRVAAVARLKPGVDAERAQQELRTIARRNQPKEGGTLVRLTPLEGRFWRSYSLFFFAIATAMALVVCAAVIGTLAAAIRRSPPSGAAARYWGFFVLKTALLLAAAASIALEVIPGPLSLWALLVLGAGAMWWTVRDQRRRCRFCLHRLTMPVTTGSWSSPLLDPAGTELLCERGHGALHVPEMQSSDHEQWTPLDESWRELFTDPKP